MTQQIINIGTTPNDGTGDNLRTSSSKINSNFTELYTQTISSVPTQASAVGYNTLTFGPVPTLGTVAGTLIPTNWYGSSSTGAATQNSNGSLLVNPTTSYGVGTAAQATFPNWKGVAFGGGLYAEIVWSWPAGSGTISSGWPAFWANDIETMSQNGISSVNTWPNVGQAVFTATTGSGTTVMNISSVTSGTVRVGMGLTFTGATNKPYISSFGTFNGTSGTVNLSNASSTWTSGVTITTATPFGNWVEMDILEYDAGVTNKFGTATHNWYGAIGYGTKTDVNWGSPFTLLPTVSFSNVNKTGWLWVPATSTSQGFSKLFYNGVQVGNTIVWNLYDSTIAPPPVAGTTAGSIIDTRHMAFIFNSGSGYSVTINSFTVWQATAANNLIQ